MVNNIIVESTITFGTKLKIKNCINYSGTEIGITLTNQYNNTFIIHNSAFWWLNTKIMKFGKKFSFNLKVIRQGLSRNKGYLTFYRQFFLNVFIMVDILNGGRPCFLCLLCSTDSKGKFTKASIMRNYIWIEKSQRRHPPQI